MAPKLSQASDQIFVERRIRKLSLPLKVGELLRHPEQIVLAISDYTMDVGSVCYLHRSHVQRKGKLVGGATRPCGVDLSSLSSDRVAEVRKLIRFLSDRLTVDGYRSATVYGHWSALRLFLNWCDLNKYFGVLSGAPAIHPAMKEYVDQLQEQIDNHTMRRKTAYSRQAAVENVLSAFLNTHDLYRGVNVIKFLGDEPSTAAPDEADLAKANGLCDAIFNGLTDFVLGDDKYPYKLMMPGYLKWEQNWLWIFPEQHWCVPPTMTERYNVMHRRARNYDYTNGRPITYEEAVSIYSVKYRARNEILRSRTQLECANSNPRHYFRVQLAMKAHNAFVFMFLSQTGLNFEVARDLPWESEMHVGVAQQHFRAVKWRSGGKEISVVIRSQFLPLFQKFLKLREYILEQRTFNMLFLTIGNGRNTPRKMGRSTVSNLYGTLLRIDPSLHVVSPQDLRSAKQDFHINKEEPSIAAKLMGHSEGTALKAYSAGTKSRHYAEFSEFLGKVKDSALRRVVLARHDDPPKSRPGNLGICTRFNFPSPIEETVPVIPDCNKQEGCLFCDKYRVHADEVDVRKLASCAYVIEQTANVPGSEAYFAPVLERIRAILNEISEVAKDREMVKRTLHAVNVCGELSTYWADKLALLDELEIVR